jgi:Right handed beta helix region
VGAASVRPMRRRSIALAGTALAGALALAGGAGAFPHDPYVRPTVLHVRSEAEFAAAEALFRRSGGRIVLHPALYRSLVVGPRSRRPLRIAGMRGVRVERVLLDGTRRVSFGRVTLGPIGGDALLEVRGSRDVVVHDLVVTAEGTRFSSSILVPDSRGVTIRASNFMHCGDRAPDFTNCITLYRWSHRILIEDNRFHDCLGCDFVHGRFGTDLTIRRNRFDRSLPCRMGAYRCGHQDLVQLFAGRRLRVVANRFGVYRNGGAQLYLTNDVDYATIVNNVFAATDPKVPGYRARMGIVVGSNASERLPYYAKIVNNTILSGALRKDGYRGSIRMSSRYGSVPRWKRPIVANNVIALLETPARVCNGSQRFIFNVVVRGKTCSQSDLEGEPDLDGRGRPRAASAVIDGANRHYAPTVDATGRRRTGRPDIGAFEFRRPG